MNQRSYRIRKIESSLPLESSDLSPKKYRDFLETCEREYLKSALESVDGNASELANRIGLGRSTVFKKLRELGCALKDQLISTSKKREVETRSMQ